MKVLLANPATRISLSNKLERYFIKAGSRWPWSFIKRKDEKMSNSCFPFYLAYAANILKNSGHEVNVIDGVALDMQDSEFLSRTKAINPDVLIIETQTHSMEYDLNLIKKIKSQHSKLKVIITGAHATIYSNEILTKNDFVDFVVKGEYEFLVDHIVAKLADKKEDFDAEGICYRKKKKIILSDKKGFIDDINKLPYPAFELFPMNEAPNMALYGDGICTYKPAVTLHSSRGCPFRCDFCLWNQVMYDNKKYRIFSPKRVVDEMEYAVNHFGAKEIYFDDDDFCVNKQHVIEICNEIKKRKLKVKWSCMGDAMSSDEEMIKAMGSSGCIFMKFGVESGNKEVLKRIEKPLRPEKAIYISKLCRKYGIMTHATFSFGLDGENLESMKDTLELANKIKFDYAQVSITTPFPGTRYYEKLMKAGKIKKTEWVDFDGTSNCVFSNDSLSAEQIEAFRKKAIVSMILHKMIDPIWVIRQIKWNWLLLLNYGPGRILGTIKAVFYMFYK
jgi:radical SAM superfamily enzyme YgiQ (UPF0313 family)